jgi:hypothetical protein
MSIGVQELAANVAVADSRNPVFRKYGFNPLFSSPIVDTGRALVAPIPRLLLDKATHGTYFDLFDYFKTAKRDHTWFTKRFGELFNSYIGRLLRDRYGKEHRVHSVDEFDFGAYRGKRCDWIVETNNVMLLIEVKATRIPRTVIESIDLEKLQDFFTTRFAIDSGVAQLEECAAYFADRFPRHRILKLMVVNDIFPHFNRLRLYLPPESDLVKRIQKCNIQFITINEFEQVLSSAALTLWTILLLKDKTEETRETHFYEFLHDKDGWDTAEELPLLRSTTDRVLRLDEIQNATRTRDE